MKEWAAVLRIGTAAVEGQRKDRAGCEAGVVFCALCRRERQCDVIFGGFSVFSKYLLPNPPCFHYTVKAEYHPEADGFRRKI